MCVQVLFRFFLITIFTFPITTVICYSDPRSERGQSSAKENYKSVFDHGRPMKSFENSRGLDNRLLFKVLTQLVFDNPKPVKRKQKNLIQFRFGVYVNEFDVLELVNKLQDSSKSKYGTRCFVPPSSGIFEGFKNPVNDMNPMPTEFDSNRGRIIHKNINKEETSGENAVFEKTQNQETGYIGNFYLNKNKIIEAASGNDGFFDRTNKPITNHKNDFDRTNTSNTNHKNDDDRTNTPITNHKNDFDRTNTSNTNHKNDDDRTNTSNTNHNNDLSGASLAQTGESSQAMEIEKSNQHEEEEALEKMNTESGLKLPKINLHRVIRLLYPRESFDEGKFKTIHLEKGQDLKDITKYRSKHLAGGSSPSGIQRPYIRSRRASVENRPETVHGTHKTTGTAINQNYDRDVIVRVGVKNSLVDNTYRHRVNGFEMLTYPTRTLTRGKRKIDERWDFEKRNLSQNKKRVRRKRSEGDRRVFKNENMNQNYTNDSISQQQQTFASPEETRQREMEDYKHRKTSKNEKASKNEKPSMSDENDEVGPLPSANTDTDYYYSVLTSCRDQCGLRKTRPCSCDVTCFVYKVCCEDITDTCPSLENEARKAFGDALVDIHPKKVQCHSSDALVIAACPEGTEENVSFPKNQSLLVGFENIAVVYDNETGLVFKNRTVYNCYRSGLTTVGIESLRYWNVVYEISKEFNFVSDHGIDGLNPLKTLLNLDPGKATSFYPGSDSLVGYRCLHDAITTCNDDLAFLDPDGKCGTFLSYYEHPEADDYNIYLPVYGNKYCFFCNTNLTTGKPFDKGVQGERSYKFSMVLNFDRDEKISLQIKGGNSLGWSVADCAFNDIVQENIIQRPNPGTCQVKECQLETIKSLAGDSCLRVGRLNLIFGYPPRKFRMTELLELSRFISCYIEYKYPGVYKDLDIKLNVTSSLSHVTTAKFPKGEYFMIQFEYHFKKWVGADSYFAKKVKQAMVFWYKTHEHVTTMANGLFLFKEYKDRFSNYVISYEEEEAGDGNDAHEKRQEFVEAYPEAVLMGLVSTTPALDLRVHYPIPLVDQKWYTEMDDDIIGLNTCFGGGGKGRGGGGSGKEGVGLSYSDSNQAVAYYLAYSESLIILTAYLLMVATRYA